MASTLADTVNSETMTTLSEYIVDIEYSDIPDAVLETERWHLFDTIGCAIYGSSRPWLKQIHGAMETLGERGDASLLSSSISVSPARAALINGTAAHALDYDDHTQDGGLHAGCTTVPPALAYAETADHAVSGKELLAAVTVGDEVGIRSGIGIGISSLRDGFHIAGWTGAFASAATTGKLWGLDYDEVGHALGIAGTQGCGLTGAHSSGADVKRFHMGKAGEAGYLGVALADQGFTGDRRIFEDRHGGIGRTMAEDFDIPGVTAQLGDDYRIIEKLSLKTFPAVGMNHGAIDALEEILEEHNLTAEDIEEATIGVTEVTKAHVGWEFEPTGVMAAQSCVQYAVTSYLVDGDIGIGSYTDEAIRRPELLERLNDVDVVLSEDLMAVEPASFGADLEVVTKDGRTYRTMVVKPRGYPENPMSADELKQKFRTQAEAVIPADDVDQLIDLTLNITELDDVRVLFEYLP